MNGGRNNFHNFYDGRRVKNKRQECGIPSVRGGKKKVIDSQWVRRWEIW
jgi:hypothetical protein